MNSRTALLSGLPLLAFALSALADNEIIGTVEMTLDGNQKTWYVLDPGDNMQPTAMWLAMGPQRGVLSIAAYDTPDIEFERDELTGSAVPAHDAPALVFSIGFPLGADKQSYTFPVQPPDGPAAVLLLPNWSDPTAAYDISLDPGQLHLTGIEASTEGPSRFTGTVTGVLRNDEDDTMSLEGGVIDIEEIPFFSPPA